ncbi:Ktr system potassium uptake protein A [compost metagenome]
MKVPDCLHNKTLSSLNARVRFGCSIVALQKEAGVIIAPTALDSLHTGDIMVIIGTNDNIERFEEEVISQED